MSFFLEVNRIIRLEAFKILNRRTLLVLLIFSSLAFPLFVKVITYLESIEKTTNEGAFLELVASSCLLFMTSIVFIPLWVSVFVGSELSNGYVNRMVFLTSRGNYFISKLMYCFLISVFFTALSAGALLVSVRTSIFSELLIPEHFIILFILQTFLVACCYSLTILAITFWVRKATTALVLSYILPQVDGIIYMLFSKLLSINLNLLPFKLLESLYKKPEVGFEMNYINPITEHPQTLIAPIFFAVVVTYLSYKWFQKRDLKPISD
jgi:hypothetical protein